DRADDDLSLLPQPARLAVQLARACRAEPRTLRAVPQGHARGREGAPEEDRGYAERPGRRAVRAAHLLLAGAVLLAAAVQAQEPPARPKFFIKPTGVFFEHLYEGEFVEPTSAFLDAKAGELWVTDTRNNLIAVFTTEGVPLFTFGSNEIKEPTKLAVDLAGRVYVIDIDRS